MSDKVVPTPIADAAERTIESFDPSDTAVSAFVARKLEKALVAMTKARDEAYLAGFKAGGDKVAAMVRDMAKGLS